MIVSARSHEPADSVKRATAALEPGALSSATNSSEGEANTNVHGLSEPGVPTNPGRFTSLPEFQHGVELAAESPWRSWYTALCGCVDDAPEANSWPLNTAMARASS
jgi:hypothetical protein